MKKTLFTLSLFLFVFQFINSQTNKIFKDNEPIQTMFQFENPLPKAEAFAKFKSQNKLGKSTSYVPTYSNTDETGRKHEHFQQYYSGLKIEFGVIITHSFDNEVYMINGEVYNASSLNLLPTISIDIILLLYQITN